jgi:hypothetical protein
MTTKTDKHVAYMHQRYMYTDENNVHQYTPEHPVYCRDWRDGRMVLCDTCEVQAKKDYPQGWDYYPGDRCEHGKYVGGCGPDIMCGKCEGE